MNLEYEEKLLAHDVRPTAVRLLVLEALGHDGRAYSLTELEAKLGTVDKSTIFRTLTLFRDHNLVHSIEDRQGQTRYAPCEEGCQCHEAHGDLEYLHPHFECERCGRVYCLRDVELPAVTLPHGFHLHTGTYVLSGYCPACARLAHCVH